MKTETDEERGVKISTPSALDLLGRFQKSEDWPAGLVIFKNEILQNTF